jgi:hypothetical protein
MGRPQSKASPTKLETLSENKLQKVERTGDVIQVLEHFPINPSAQFQNPSTRKADEARERFQK